MKRDLLSLRDLSAAEIHQLIARAREMKLEQQSGKLRPTLAGKILGLIFMKPSTRTRVSFETAMYRLGGQCLFMTANDLQLSRQEPLADTARVLSRYLDALVIRTFRSSGCGRTGPLCGHSHHQRVDRSLPSLSGAERSRDHSGKTGQPGWPLCSLDR